jgi:hypothetical protein
MPHGSGASRSAAYRVDTADPRPPLALAIPVLFTSW